MTLKLLLGLAGSALLMSCHSTKNIQSSISVSDSTYKDSSNYWQTLYQNEHTKYENVLKESSERGVVFQDCPPAKIPDSVLLALDTAARLRLALWQSQQTINGLKNKIKINADGSIEVEGRIQSAYQKADSYSKQAYDLSTENSAIKRYNETLQGEVKTLKEQTSKVVVRKSGFMNFFWVGLIFVIIGIVIGWVLRTRLHVALSKYED